MHDIVQQSPIFLEPGNSYRNPCETVIRLSCDGGGSDVKKKLDEK